MGTSESKNEPQVDLDQYIQSQEHQHRMQQVYTGQQQLGVYQSNDYEEIIEFYRYRQQGGVVPRQLAEIEKSDAIAVKNDLYINKTTLKMVPIAQQRFALQFQYTSSSSPAVISLYWLAIETNGMIQTKAPYQCQNVFNVPAVQSQEFKETSFYLDLNMISAKKLSYYDNNNNAYPLILQIAKPGFSYTYYCSLSYDNGILNVHNHKNTINVNGQEFTTLDVFGINDSVVGNKPEGEKEMCKVCLTDPINTMILPCKHTALCVDCAETLRARRQAFLLCRQGILDDILDITKYVILQKAQQDQSQINEMQPQQPILSDPSPQNQYQANPPQQVNPQPNQQQYFKGQGYQL